MMKIKGIIFDLDDTLYDCSHLRMVAVNSGIEALAGLGEKEVIKKRYSELAEKFGPRENLFQRVVESFNGDEALVKKARDAYNNSPVENICPFEGVENILEELKQEGYSLILVTFGNYNRQKKKIDALGLAGYFNDIFICDSETGYTKPEAFETAIKRIGARPENIVCVGDNIYSEIKTGNKLGLKTVRILRGLRKELKPKSSLEQADHTIKGIGELLNVLKQIEKGMVNIVCIGGGTGLPVVLSGLKKYTKNLTAVVTVTDSGRSSGEMRKEFGILAPGDIRNCLVALSDSEKIMKDLFQYRFNNGRLNGTSFGNLLIAALSQNMGSFEKAVENAGKILAINGKVLPSTLEDTHICAELEAGNILREELKIVLNRKKIKKVFLNPEKPKAYEKVLDAIEKADVITLGPGCLYTSIIANLMVDGVADAIKRSKAKTIYINNIMTQPGQTEGFTMEDHVKEISKYLGFDVDFTIANNAIIPEEVLKNYEQESAFIVKDGNLSKLKTKVIKSDVIENVNKKREHFGTKKDYIRHDSEKLAKAIMNIAQNH